MTNNAINLIRLIDDDIWTDDVYIHPTDNNQLDVDDDDPELVDLINQSNDNIVSSNCLNCVNKDINECYVCDNYINM